MTTEWYLSSLFRSCTKKNKQNNAIKYDYRLDDVIDSMFNFWR